MILSAKDKLVSVYLNEHPESAAIVLMRDGHSAVSSMIKKHSANDCVRVLNYIPASVLKEAFLPIEDQVIAKIANKMHANLIGGVFRTWLRLGHKDRVEKILGRMEENNSKSISNLISYPDNCIGSVMNSTPFSVQPELTIKEVLHVLAKEKNRYSRYIYVVNSEAQLIGVLPFKDAFYADENLLISKVMTTDVVSFDPDFPVQLAFESHIWSKWDSIPIVSPDKELLGVLRYDVLESQFARKISSIEDREELKKAGEAVGEVIKIGLSATLSAFGISGNNK